MPHRFRSSYVKNTLVIEGYGLWCALKGEEFSYPAFPSEEGNYIVTKSIPGLGFTFLGKRFQFTDSIPLEYVPSSSNSDERRELVDRIVAETKQPIRYVGIVHAKKPINGAE